MHGTKLIPILFQIFKLGTVLVARMEEIEGEMKDANEETKASLQKEWDKLDGYRSILDARMEKVGDNMESGWKDFKGDVKKGWRDFSEKSEAFLEEIETTLE